MVDLLQFTETGFFRFGCFFGGAFTVQPLLRGWKLKIRSSHAPQTFGQRSGRFPKVTQPFEHSLMHLQQYKCFYQVLNHSCDAVLFVALKLRGLTVHCNIPSLMRRLTCN